MKKQCSIIFTALMLCSMLVLYTVPAVAASEIEISSFSELKDALESLKDGQEISLLIKNDMRIDDEIEINSDNCTIHFNAAISNGNKLKFYPNYDKYTKGDYFRFLDINGDKVTVDFGGKILCSSFRSPYGNTYISANGACVYLNGEGCCVKGGHFSQCTTSENGSGGAIFVNRDNCKIENCIFENCEARNGGGAIGFEGIIVQGTADNGLVRNCTFRDCKCGNYSVVTRDEEFYGDDIYGCSTSVEYCTSNAQREDHFFMCNVTPQETFTYYINNGSELKTIMENNILSECKRRIVFTAPKIEVSSAIDIKVGREVSFEVAEGIGECLLVSTDDEAPLFRVNKFVEAKFTFSKYIKITSTNNDDDGGAIYIDSGAAPCVIDGGHFYKCSCDGDGGAIYLGSGNCVVKNAMFSHNNASVDGGAIYINDDAAVEDCKFQYNSAGDDGGSICDGNSVGDVYIRRCVFRGGSCHGDGIWIDCNNDAHLDGCTKDDGGRYYKPASCTNIDYNSNDDFDEDFSYKRPIISTYARVAMDNNKQCDVIRPDMADTVKSDNGLFTLKGTNAYGSLWDVTYKDPLTITAKEGYTIKRIEGIITEKDNYDVLSIDKGKKKKSIDNPYCNPFSKNYIAIFEDINAKSVTFTTKGNLKNYGTVHFSEFVIYYTKDTVAESASSGGSGGAAGIVTNSNDEDAMINNNDEGVVTNSNDDAILEGSTPENSDNNDAPAEVDENYTGSSLSAGVLWIAIAIAVAAIAASILLVSRKSKDKLSAVDDEDE